MRHHRSIPRSLACIALAFALAGGLAACKTNENPGARPLPATRAIVARLAPVAGSVARGSVTFGADEGGVIMVANFGGVSPGRHRVAVHVTANCTSPNGFSAGPPMMIPGTSTPIVFAVSADGGEGTVSTTVRIVGLALDGPNGLDGKSVVVHFGTAGALEASPGVGNGRMACGVLAPATGVL